MDVRGLGDTKKQALNWHDRCLRVQLRVVWLKDIRGFATVDVVFVEGSVLVIRVVRSCDETGTKKMIENRKARDKEELVNNG